MLESLGIIFVLVIAAGYGLYALVKKAVKDALREVNTERK